MNCLNYSSPRAVLGERADLLTLLFDGYAEWSGGEAKAGGELKPAQQTPGWTARADGKMELRITSLEQLTGVMRQGLI